MPMAFKPILDQNCVISIHYLRRNCLETIPFTVEHTYVSYLGEYTPPLPPQWTSNYFLLSGTCLAVVEKMKRRRSAKTSDTEEAMDTTEDKSPVTLSADR